MKSLLSSIYLQAADLKNYLYDHQLVSSLRLPRPVISVGNLTMGGTGKTPVVHLLLRYLEKTPYSVSLISRNYKARSKDFQKVKLQANGALEFGDEPYWLSQKHPQVQVYVGPSKSDSARRAFEQSPTDIYVVDDGFQHRALARDLDIVLVDASQGKPALQALPLGAGRESLQGLRRAQIVLLTKTEALSDLQRKDWLEFLRPYTQAHFFCLRNHLLLPENISNKKIFAFSGIAHPEVFENAIAVTCLSFAAHRFDDHHNYTPSDLDFLQKKADGADLILTTEKDFVKIESFSRADEFFKRLRPVPLQMEFIEREDAFYAMVDSYLR